MHLIPSQELISLDRIKAIVKKIIKLPVAPSLKAPTKDNFFTINLDGIVDMRACQQSTTYGDILAMDLFGGSPSLVKNIIDSFSRNNALGKPYISSIDVKFRDDVCPQILRDKGCFDMSKNGWSKYRLYDLDGTENWQHAINFEKAHGEPNNEEWSIACHMYWLWSLEKQNILSN